MKETLANGSFQKDKKITVVMENNGYLESITTEEIQEYELSWFKGEIILIDNFKTFSKVIPGLMKERLLGFDTETRPSFKKGHKNRVSLIQLSTRNKAYLFRINKIGIPPELVAILANAEITKAGVAVHDDIRFLRSVRKFNPAGFIDLQNFVQNFGIKSSGLKKLTAIILGFRISKRQQVTDWEAEVLSEPQQVYAATDAWVCFEIYNKLTSIN
jgi:ribonuclease D